MNKKLIAKVLWAKTRKSVSHTRSRMFWVLLGALAISGPSFAAQTNILVNGDFEDPPLPCRLWVAVPEGSGFITGWNMNVASTNNDNGGCDSFPNYSHSVDVLFCTSGPYYAHTGHQSIDMSGTYSTPGDSIYQDVPTKPGRIYTLIFYTSSNVDPISNGLTVEWNDVPIDTISTPVQGQWTEHSYAVQATSEMSRLRFVGNIGGGQGSFVDTVSLLGDVDDVDEPPVVSCPPAITVPVGSVPPAATNVADFTAQGGSISDDHDPNPSVVGSDEVSGSCPTLVTRTYTVTDSAGHATQCQQLITVQNRLEGILWFPPVAPFCKTNEYVFKYGRTVPIKIRPLGCDGTNLTRNTNIIATLQVLALSDCQDPSTAQPVAIDNNGGTTVLMEKCGGHLKYNLNTKKLPTNTPCFLLKATSMDISTGESLSETLPIHSRSR
jgi:hypothetical protein